MKENSPRQSGRFAELPLLEQLTIGQSTIESKALLVLALLRDTALQFQDERLHPFYSIRAVADHFGLPPATVARLYARLTSERLLRPVWGSRTLLEPLESAQARKPRCVAVPVEVNRFCSLPAYREAILSIQRELWSHRVPEQLLFFEHSPAEVLHLCKRYHLPRIDVVIWVFPEKVTRDRILLKLSALGIRVVCIAANPVAGARECFLPLPGCTIGKIVREQVLRSSRTGLLELPTDPPGRTPTEERASGGCSLFSSDAK